MNMGTSMRLLLLLLLLLLASLGLDGRRKVMEPLMSLQRALSTSPTISGVDISFTSLPDEAKGSTCSKIIE
jgi:hypothetical protein